MSKSVQERTAGTQLKATTLTRPLWALGQSPKVYVQLLEELQSSAPVEIEAIAHKMLV